MTNQISEIQAILEAKGTLVALKDSITKHGLDAQLQAVMHNTECLAHIDKTSTETVCAGIDTVTAALDIALESKWDVIKNTISAMFSSREGHIAKLKTMLNDQKTKLAAAKDADFKPVEGFTGKDKLAKYGMAMTKLYPDVKKYCSATRDQHLNEIKKRKDNNEFLEGVISTAKREYWRISENISIVTHGDMTPVTISSLGEMRKYVDTCLKYLDTAAEFETMCKAVVASNDKELTTKREAMSSQAEDAIYQVVLFAEKLAVESYKETSTALTSTCHLVYRAADSSHV